MDEQIKKYIESEEGKAIVTLIAYTIRKTPTEADDAILEKSDEMAKVIASALSNAREQIPTDKEAKRAGVVLLESIAKQTKTKIDDAIVAILKKIVS